MFNLSGTFSFKGGIHPPHNKHRTEKCAIEILPPPPKVIIPLSQHIGAPARILAKKGNEVKIGQVLAESGGFVSCPVHASVSGKVSAIADFPHPSGRNLTAIEIENDGRDEKMPFTGLQWRDSIREEIVKKIADAGIVGMGGASFPSHVKLSPPAGKTIDTLIINGAECEPYLTADHRLMLEKAVEILTGAAILKKVLNANRVFISIESNKPDAIARLTNVLAGGSFEKFSIARLQTKYPQGGEKQLIQAVTRRQVPSGGLPMDAGCVVHNAGTAFAVWDAVVNGTPLYQRVMTVTGPAIGKPANLLVRIGTPMRHIIEYCQIDYGAIKKLIMGGPMMGIAQNSFDAPVLKATSGILALDTVEQGERSHNCIGCGNCVRACPIKLVPSYIAKFIETNDFDQAEQWNCMDCIECGSCAYVCPAKINLVHFMKLGKFHVSAARAKAAATKKTAAV